MASAYKFVVLLIVCGGLLANGDDNSNSSLGGKCGAEFQKVVACLTYATGKAPSPSKECCDAATDIKNKDPVCLCYLIEQIHKGSSPELKSMGIQEAKLLQLPSACKIANASISNCPKLLNIPPNSPDNAIFTNSSKVTGPTPAGASSTSSAPDTTKDSSDGFKNAPQLSVAGTVVAAAFVAIFITVIPKELLVF